MREDAQRQAAGLQLRDAGIVAQQSRSVTGVGVAHRTQVLVVATDECGTAANSAGNLQDGAVNRMAEPNHRFRLVEVLTCEEIGRKTSKGALSGNEDGARVLSAAGQVEQPEQDPRRAHPQEFVEVAGHALAVVHGGDLCPVQHRHVGMPRIPEAQHSFPALEQGAHEIRWRQSQRPNNIPGSCHSPFPAAFVRAFEPVPDSELRFPGPCFKGLIGISFR